MSSINKSGETAQSSEPLWQFHILGETYRDDHKEVYVAARLIQNPGEVGEGCIYFDTAVNRIAFWGFDDLIGYDIPPRLLEDGEIWFEQWLARKEPEHSLTSRPSGS